MDIMKLIHGKTDTIVNKIARRSKTDKGHCKTDKNGIT